MESVRQSTSGLRIEHLDNGRIVAFTFENISRDTVDAWVVAFTALLENGSAPYRVLMNVASPNLAFTPYFRRRSLEMVNNYPHVPGWMAIVFRNQFYSTIVEFFMRGQRQKGFEPGFFMDYEQAVAWLRKIE